jgi:hypothetical protein
VLKNSGGSKFRSSSQEEVEKVVDPPCLLFEPQCENWVAVVTFHTQNTCGLPPVVGGATQHRVLEIQ